MCSHSPLFTADMNLRIFTGGGFSLSFVFQEAQYRSHHLQQPSWDCPVKKKKKTSTQLCYNSTGCQENIEIQQTRCFKNDMTELLPWSFTIFCFHLPKLPRQVESHPLHAQGSV